MLEMIYRSMEMSLCLSLPCQWWGVYLQQNVQRMKQSLPRELEKHLKKNCLSLLSYYQPEWGIVDKDLHTDLFLCVNLSTNFAVYFFFFFAESESDGLKTTKLSHLSSQLEQEKKRTESLKETCKENMVLLQRQTQLYLCVRSIFFLFLMKTGSLIYFCLCSQTSSYFFTEILHYLHIFLLASICVQELTKCIQLLQSLIMDCRLKIQTDLDRKKLDYFEAKCELVLQKVK